MKSNIHQQNQKTKLNSLFAGIKLLSLIGIMYFFFIILPLNAYQCTFIYQKTCDVDLIDNNTYNISYDNKFRLINNMVFNSHHVLCNIDDEQIVVQDENDTICKNWYNLFVVCYGIFTLLFLPFALLYIVLVKFSKNGRLSI